MCSIMNQRQDKTLTFKAPWMMASFLLGVGFSDSILAYSMEHVRDRRYCEVILSKAKMTLSVYNSLGLNDCPATLWDRLDRKQLKKQTHAWLLYLNGPRHMMMDTIEDVNMVKKTPRLFDGLAMREVAAVKIRAVDMLYGEAPYHEHIVQRHTTFVYHAHQPIYELISPKGVVYVMQSYSVQKKKQTLDSLATLNTQLRLPKNWSFKSEILTKNKKLVINHEAIVVQDNFANTYQRAPANF